MTEGSLERGAGGASLEALPVVTQHRRAAGTRAIRLGGFVPFTTTDWPGRLAAVVFTQGCPWRCGYCHNPHLLPAVGNRTFDEWDEIVTFLASRHGLLDGVVFSGGEPTAQAALPDAIADVHGSGLAVALHTAGIHPRRLERVLRHVDWIGFDLKAPVADYGTVTGVAGSGARAMASLDLVCASGVPFEVRTTVHPRLTPPAALQVIAELLAAHGIARWVLQPFRATGCADAALVAAAPRGVTLDAACIDRLRTTVKDIVVRA
jgi:pyruvate formate lyase activating enzyme